MADAESNLVPSEAADQVEVALEAQAAADDGIMYLNEYQYENDLVTDFARLVASPRRRGSLYVAAAIAAHIKNYAPFFPFFFIFRIDFIKGFYKIFPTFIIIFTA